MELILVAVVLISLIVLRFEYRPVSEPMLRFVALVTAAAIVGRLLFAGVPNVQPATALVLLLAACVSPIIGAIAGMLVVVLTSLFLGSGPFVLFQIIAYAAISLFCVFPGMKSRVLLSVYGAMAGFLYGWISNLGFLIFTGFSPEAFVTLLLTGGVFDLLHGVSNAVFIWMLHPIFLRMLHSFDGKSGK